MWTDSPPIRAALRRTADVFLPTLLDIGR